MVTISVLMPVYNEEKYIAEAIDSVLNQTFKDFELLIIDDLSKDKSYEVAKEYEKKDKRIRVFRLKKKRYRSGALDYGIKKAKGKYICFLDGDDVYNRNKLKIQVSYLNKYPEVDMVFGKTKYFGEISRESSLLNKEGLDLRKLLKERAKLDEDFLRKIHVGLFLGMTGSIPSCSVMIRERLFKKVKFDEKLRRTQDYDLWFQIIGRGFKIKGLNKIFYYYRTHKNQATRDKKEIEKAKEYIIKKLKSGEYLR
jgi:glycosyltransferase involved in cell wall biosynthesis